MLKTIALARLILGGKMNLQAPPNLTPEGYPIYLRAGVNDWGGVSPLTPDFINPEAPWPALVELQRRTRDAGYVLRARLPIYPEFITDEFVAAALRLHIEDLAGADGLVNETIERRMLPREVSENAPR
jgi:FO synthase